MTRQTYSDADKANAMAHLTALGWKPGGHISAKMAREVGVPLRTLKHWAEGDVKACATGNVASLQTKAEESLADLCERFARGAFGYGVNWLEKFENTPDGRMLRDVMVAAGIAVDKMRLLRDQPTARLAVEDARRAVESGAVTVDELIDEVNAIARAER